jgi:predicted membrane protein
MNQIMEKKQKCNSKPLFGIVLILAGVALIARQLDMIPYNIENVLFTWQSFLILLGVIFLSNRSNRLTGFILIGVGGFFLLPEIVPVEYEVRKLFWPVVIILVGLALIFGGTSWYRRRLNVSGSDADYLDDVNVFGGHDRIITSGSFRGGSIVNVFGGGKYDFRQCKLGEGENVLETVNVFGGGKFLVPSDWDVKVEVMAIFGGFTDKRNITTTDSSKKLIIKGVAVFGGGELTSF